MTFATTLFRVAAPCLLAGVAYASPVSISVPAADGGVPVPVTVYTSALPYRPAAPEAVRPDQAWREQNRIVGAYDSMALTMGTHAGHAAAAADPHAAHAGHAAAHGDHAGHGAAAGAPADPHARHRMPATPRAPSKAADHSDHAGAADPAPAAHQHGGQP